MIQHDEAFWLEHERRRVEQNASVAQYCAANGLALSTFGHRVSGKKRTASGQARASSSKSAPSSAAFVAVTAQVPEASAPAGIDVTLQGMTMHLQGQAAERVLDQLLRRLG